MSNPVPSAELIAKFKAEVHDRAEDIDGGNEHHWGTLTLGWAIANGLSVNPNYTDEEAPTNAHYFATYIRYSTDLG